MNLLYTLQYDSPLTTDIKRLAFLPLAPLPHLTLFTLEAFTQPLHGLSSTCGGVTGPDLPRFQLT